MMNSTYKPMLLSCLFLLIILSSACTMIIDPITGQTRQMLYGESSEMGQGTVRTYAELNADGSPVSIGVVFTSGLLEGLPSEFNEQGICFDKNGNGSIELHEECVGDYELALTMPAALAEQTQIPFKWASVNWNPLGHLPPAAPAWGVPHFDFHFYMLAEEAVDAIRPGTCGHLMDCEDFAHAQIPIPTDYLPPNYKMSSAVPAMGQHLIDPTAPELADPPQAPFTHSFLYGAYDGHLIFYEPMIAHDFLVSRPNECKAFPLPAAWETSGYYPTELCIRYQEDSQEYTVSLETFVYRQGNADAAKSSASQPPAAGAESRRLDSEARASRTARFYCPNATVMRTCATITTTKAGSVTIQIKNHPLGGSECHLAVPSTVPDRPPARVTDVHLIDSITSDPIRFESAREVKIFAAGARLQLRCIRDPHVPPGGDAGIGGFLYYP